MSLDRNHGAYRYIETPQLTRSKTSPFNREVCFFCDEQAGYRQSLHNISTFSAGESLRAAVELSGNDKLRVKLSTAVDASDAHAIDIKYHKNVGSLTLPMCFEGRHLLLLSLTLE